MKPRDSKDLTKIKRNSSTVFLHGPMPGESEDPSSREVRKNLTQSSEINSSQPKFQRASQSSTTGMI